MPKTRYGRKVIESCVATGQTYKLDHIGFHLGSWGYDKSQLEELEQCFIEAEANYIGQLIAETPHICKYARALKLIKLIKEKRLAQADRNPTWGIIVREALLGLHCRNYHKEALYFKNAIAKGMPSCRDKINDYYRQVTSTPSPSLSEA